MILHIKVLPERFIISSDRARPYSAKGRSILTALHAWLQKTKTSLRDIKEIVLELENPLGFGRIRNTITVLNALGAAKGIVLSFAGSKNRFPVLPTPYPSDPTITMPRKSRLCT